MYCAFIGDLIQSKDIQPTRREAVQKRLRQLLDEMNAQFSDYLASPFLVTLGDEFQGLLTAAEPALEIMEYIDRGLAEYRVQARYGLGLGEISTGPVNRAQALGDDGPAYHYAREGVELLKEEGWRGFPVSIQTKQADAPLLHTICQLLNSLMEDWSEAQRQYALDMELLGEQLLVAEKNHIQQSSVSRALKRGRYKLYQQTKTTLREYLLSTYDCPESAGLLGQYNRAVILIRNRNYEKAQPLLEELLLELPESGGSEPPNRGDLLYLLSQCWNWAENYSQAIEEIQAAIQWEEQWNMASPRLAALYAQLGHYYLRWGERLRGEQEGELTQKALQVLQTALGLCRNAPLLEVDIRNGLALVYKRKKEYQQAIDARLELQTFIEENRMQVSTAGRQNLHNLSVAYELNGQLDDAMKAAEAAVQIADQLAAPQGRAGRVYLRYARLLKKRQERPETVISLLEKALAHAKRDNDTRTVRSACLLLESLYRETGNDEAASWAAEQRLRAERILRKRPEESPE